MHVHNNIVLSRIIKRRRYFGTEIYVPDNEPRPRLVFRVYALNQHERKRTKLLRYCDDKKVNEKLKKTYKQKQNKFHKDGKL